MVWSLDEPFVPALSDIRVQFLLRGTDGDMEGIVYPDAPEPAWVPGDNSGGFTASDLREIADLLDGVARGAAAKVTEVDYNELG